MWLSDWTEYIVSWKDFPGDFGYCTVWLQSTSWNCLLERWPCLNSCLMIYPGTWLDGRCHLQSRRPCEYEEPNSTMFKVVVLEDGPKEILFPAPLWSSGIESQGKLFMDCQLEWNVPEETPKACVSSPSPLPVCLGHILVFWNTTLQRVLSSVGGVTLKIEVGSPA